MWNLAGPWEYITRHNALWPFRPGFRDGRRRRIGASVLAHSVGARAADGSSPTADVLAGMTEPNMRETRAHATGLRMRHAVTYPASEVGPPSSDCFGAPGGAPQKPKSPGAFAPGLAPNRSAAIRSSV